VLGGETVWGDKQNPTSNGSYGNSIPEIAPAVSGRGGPSSCSSWSAAIARTKPKSLQTSLWVLSHPKCDAVVSRERRCRLAALRGCSIAAPSATEAGTEHRSQAGQGLETSSDPLDGWCKEQSPFPPAITPAAGCPRVPVSTDFLLS